LSKKSATNRKSLNSNKDLSKNDLGIQQSFAPPNKPTYTQQINDYQSYAQIAAGNSKTNTSLQRIEQLLKKQSELTNNLLNMIMLLVNKLCL